MAAVLAVIVRAEAVQVVAAEVVGLTIDEVARARTVAAAMIEVRGAVAIVAQRARVVLSPRPRNAPAM